MESGRTALIGTFGPRSAAELLRVLAEPEAARCDLVEVRLDLVPEAIAHVEQLVAAAPVPVLATCRRASDGGAFAGDEQARLALLSAAVSAGATWVDVEHDVPDAALAAFRKVRVLRSVHVRRLPDDVAALAARLLAAPAAAGKLVALDGDAHDAFRMLGALAAHPGRLCGHVVSQPFTRYASCLLGAPLAYAALRPGGRIGLPIPLVNDMLDTADLGRARAGTRAWVLLGGDVERSVSPQMLNAAFRGRGCDVVALRWSCDDPEPALAALQAFGWAGCAVTIPHKRTVHDLIVHRGGAIESTAATTGAVNTVLLHGGEPAGENTDVGGLMDALEPALSHSVDGRLALVIGAGGAARAAVLALRRLGASVVVHARRAEAALPLRALGGEPVESAPEALARGPAIVVDATPAGPPGGEPVVDLDALPGPAVVMDMLVAARPTALLAAAAARGHRVVPGLAMLAAQAARQVELFAGERPDALQLEAVGDALLAARLRRVVLLGLRCSGKSVVGRRLANLLGRPFVDTDELVGERTGRSPDEMIRAGDESGFRAAERQALREVARRAGVVVATGGGVALAPDELDAICAGSWVVLLDAGDPVLLARLAAAPRAALSSLPPAAEIARQRSERMPMYESRSVRTERTDARDEQEVAESIAAWVVRESTASVCASSVPSVDPLASTRGARGLEPS